MGRFVIADPADKRGNARNLEESKRWPFEGFSSSVFSGSSAVQLTQQLAEHKGQDASVPVIVHLNGRIDAKFDRLFNNGPVLARNAQGDVLTRHDIIRKPEDIGDFGAVKGEGLRGDAVRELKWKDAHSNEV